MVCRRVPRKMFEHEHAGRAFKHLPRDPANDNERKNMIDRYSCMNILYSFALSDLKIKKIRPTSEASPV